MDNFVRDSASCVPIWGPYIAFAVKETAHNLSIRPPLSLWTANRGYVPTAQNAFWFSLANEKGEEAQTPCIHHHSAALAALSPQFMSPVKRLCLGINRARVRTRADLIRYANYPGRCGVAGQRWGSGTLHFVQTSPHAIINNAPVRRMSYQSCRLTQTKQLRQTRGREQHQYGVRR